MSAGGSAAAASGGVSWSRGSALRGFARAAGLPKSIRRSPDLLEEAYALSTPGYARGWIEALAGSAGSPLSSFISECIVVRAPARICANMQQAAYAPDARAVLYNGSLFPLLSLISDAVEDVRRPAVVQFGRKIAAEAKVIVPPETAAQLMMDAAGEIVSSGRLPARARQLARLIAAYRVDLVDDGVIGAMGNRQMSDESFRAANDALGFGIAHEIAHHLLGHGRYSPNGHVPIGQTVLADWCERIGYTAPDTERAAHRRELAADALAVRLIGGERGGGWEGVLVATMASSLILGLALLDDDQSRTLDAPSATHPSFRTRMVELTKILYLAFGEVTEHVPTYVNLERPSQRGGYNFVLQNILVTQVVARLIDSARVSERGAAFGLGWPSAAVRAPSTPSRSTVPRARPRTSMNR